MIISFIPKDKDVVAYAQVCKATSIAVSSSVWHARFIVLFDPATGKTEDLAQKYMFRQEMVKLSVFFDPTTRIGVHKQGRSNKQMKPAVLKMLKDLIIESDAQTIIKFFNVPVVEGKNFRWLCRYLQCDVLSVACTDIMDAMLTNDDNEISDSKSYGAELLVIQICLAPFALNRFYHASNKLMHFDESQRMVYAHQEEEPLFLGTCSTNINARWVLHALNFFKFHMRAAGGEGILNTEYDAFDHHLLPQFWTGKLTGGTQTLDHRWIGAYTFLDYPELIKIRLPSQKNGIFMDEVDSECPFSDLCIWFDEKYFGKKEWPKRWEHFLRSPLPGFNRPTTRNMPKCPEIKHFFGRAEDSRVSNFYGCIHELPPQQGIPGFQRLAMLKFFPDQNGLFDPEQVWGYEGVVLPGNRIIIGRWWDIDTVGDSYCGPFIFWNVFGSPTEERTEEKEDVIKFFDSVNDPSLID
ncbi:hypothetical protein B7463_g65, partial [Scytalidium lignicola]